MKIIVSTLPILSFAQHKQKDIKKIMSQTTLGVALPFNKHRCYSVPQCNYRKVSMRALYERICIAPNLNSKNYVYGDFPAATHVY